MTKCHDCPAPATGILVDCCDSYFGPALCDSCRDDLTCPCCETEWTPFN